VLGERTGCVGPTRRSQGDHDWTAGIVHTVLAGLRTSWHASDAGWTSALRKGRCRTLLDAWCAWLRLARSMRPARNVRVHPRLLLSALLLLLLLLLLLGHPHSILLLWCELHTRLHDTSLRLRDSGTARVELTCHVRWLLMLVLLHHDWTAGAGHLLHTHRSRHLTWSRHDPHVRLTWHSLWRHTWPELRSRLRALPRELRLNSRWGAVRREQSQSGNSVWLLTEQSTTYPDKANLR